MTKRIFLCALLLWLTCSSGRGQIIYDVTDTGAVGDGVTDDAMAIQRAIDQCSADGGGRVLLPRNHTFLAGPSIISRIFVIVCNASCVSYFHSTGIAGCCRSE